MAPMRRQSLVKFDAPLCETIVDTTKPQGKEVLVRIERCGLCHSVPLPVSQAATLSGPGVTAYGALRRLVDRPRQRNLLLIGLGGVGMMGLAFEQAMFKQNNAVADLSPAARDAALKNGATVAY